jgi:hypothetical protein
MPSIRQSTSNVQQARTAFRRWCIIWRRRFSEEAARKTSAHQGGKLGDNTDIRWSQQ